MANIIIFADTAADDLAHWPNHKKHGRSAKTAGPYRIATEVRKAGFTCQVISMFTLFEPHELEQACDKFIDSSTLVIAFSTTFWTNSKSGVAKLVSKIINQSKTLNTNIQIIFGGPNGLSLLEEVTDVDAVFLGYSEKKFTDYMITVRDGTDIPPPTRKIDNTLIYDVSSADTSFDFCRSQIIYRPEDCVEHGEPMVIEVGRGCIFKCKFCAYPLTGKKKLDFIKHHDVLTEELIYNYEQFGIDQYMLSDDTFNDSTEKIRELHRVFTALPFKIHFACYLRLDLLYAHREQITLLKEMGLRACHFGIESFHDQAARSIGKGLGGDRCKQMLRELKDELWGEDIKILISLIVGLPHETHESYQETKRWILDPQNKVDAVLINTLTLKNPIYDQSPYKSEFQIHSSKYGYYWPERARPYRWKNLSSPVKSLTEAEEIRRTLVDAVYLSNRQIGGGFGFIAMNRMVKYFEEPRTIEEQIKMSRSEYTAWITRNKNNAAELYRQSYTDSILGL
jgi:radical SAM superfamily enzyme YgiQ (UPF0313 family)